MNKKTPIKENTKNIKNKTQLYYTLTVSAFLIIIVLICIFLTLKLQNFKQNALVKEIIIEGASSTAHNVLVNFTNVLLKQKIQNIDLNKLHQLILQHQWIDKASVYRNNNGLLVIKVLEKNPYFLWQNDDGDYKVVDIYNRVIKSKLNFPVDNLILIEKGTKALENSDAIRFVLYKDFNILLQIKKITYETYRWSLHLKNGIVIKLPENNVESAYDKLIYINKKYNIINKNIDYIDITVGNKIFIMPSKINNKLKTVKIVE